MHATSSAEPVAAPLLAALSRVDVVTLESGSSPGGSTFLDVPSAACRRARVDPPDGRGSGGVGG